VGPQLDLSSQESIRSFVSQYKSAINKPIDVLVNNAGANEFSVPWYVENGVGGQCMTNYLGPYMLTRLLEDKLLDDNSSGGGGKYTVNDMKASSSSSKTTPKTTTLKPTRTARVVNVSSVTHRYGLILPDIDNFFKTWKLGSFYPNTKLANVLFSYELTRRLGSYGLQSCAVDPGGVASNIWKNSVFSKAPLSWVIKNLYAPPSDGAAAVVYAATVDWEKDREEGRKINRKRYVVGRKSSNSLTLNGVNGTTTTATATTNGTTSGAEFNLAEPSGSVFDMDRRDEASNDFRFYARGMFASPFITNTGNLFQTHTRSRSSYLPPNTPDDNNKNKNSNSNSNNNNSHTLSWSPPTLFGKAKRAAWAASTVIHSLLDWPLRRVSGGRIAAKTVVVPSAPMSYDTKVAADLWDVSARYVGVPSQPLISAGSLAKS
jgi:NAD(P)-dependent dehydrogenase (short-subunit alcohol dehydrogenase family)